MANKTNKKSEKQLAKALTEVDISFYENDIVIAGIEGAFENALAVITKNLPQLEYKFRYLNKQEIAATEFADYLNANIDKEIIEKDKSPHRQINFFCSDKWFTISFGDFKNNYIPENLPYHPVNDSFKEWRGVKDYVQNLISSNAPILALANAFSAIKFSNVKIEVASKHFVISAEDSKQEFKEFYTKITGNNIPSVIVQNQPLINAATGLQVA